MLPYVGTLTFFKTLACTFKHFSFHVSYCSLTTHLENLEIPVTILWYLDK